MFNLLGIIGLFMAGKEIIEEKTIKPYPEINDWENYYKDQSIYDKKTFEQRVYNGVYSKKKKVRNILVNRWGEGFLEDSETIKKDRMLFSMELINKWVYEGKYNYNTEWYNVYAKNYDLKNIRQHCHPDMRIEEFIQPECNKKTREELIEYEYTGEIIYKKDDGTYEYYVEQVDKRPFEERARMFGLSRDYDGNIINEEMISK